MLGAIMRGQERASGDASEDDEAALIGAAAAGDRAAFAILYERHHLRVVARLSHLVGPSAAVDDLVQETFACAWRALRTFRGEAPFLSWLLGIATRAARSEHRRRRRSIWRLFLGPGEEDALCPSVAARAETYPDLVAVHAALDRLSPPLREAVILFELEGRTLIEIAQELGVSVNTIGARVRRGREALRRRLEKAWRRSPLPMCRGEIA
jgi:RNA polymerase sigma-70 factor (ECF subfamily)